MKPIVNQARKRRAFTIVELLTVMSIIVILIGLLVPALNKVKIYAMGVKQRAQFHSIDAALELFNNEFEGYPESGALDPKGASYCGGMKLCEAMLGWDLLGFHSNSTFNRDGTSATGTFLYDPTILSSRRGPFLPLESANAYRLGELYPEDSPGLANFQVTAPGIPTTPPWMSYNYVLCDVYAKEFYKVKAGMPILYYRANTSNSMHLRVNLQTPEVRPPMPTDAAGNIYNYWDNQELLELGKPWVSGGAGTASKNHALADYKTFYNNTRSYKIQQPWRPYRADSYILISAGYDNEYGTADDICNFEWKYPQ